MDLEMARGDTPTWRLPFTDENVDPVNLTGATIRCTARRRQWVAAPADDIQWQHTSAPGDGIVVVDPPTDGVAELTLDAADTSALTGPTILSFDCQATSGDDVETVVSGRILVLPDVSTASP